MKKKMKFNTKAIHGGQILDPAYNSVMTPIYQTSTYAQSSPGKHKGYEYSRTHNPTRTNLENSIASLENGKYGLAFSSGLAAIDALLKTLKPSSLFKHLVWSATPIQIIPNLESNMAV